MPTNIDFISCKSYCMIFYEHSGLPIHNTTLDSNEYLFTEMMANRLHNFQSHITNPYVFR